MRDWYAKARNMEDVEDTLEFMKLMRDSEVSFPQFFDWTVGGRLTELEGLCRSMNVKYVSNVLMRCTDGILLIRYPGKKARQYLKGYKLQLENRSCEILEYINGDYDELASFIGKPFWSMQPTDWAYYMFCINKAETSSELIPQFTSMYYNGLNIEFPTMIEASKKLRYENIYHVHPRDLSFLSNPEIKGIIIDDHPSQWAISNDPRVDKLDVAEGSGTNHALT